MDPDEKAFKIPYDQIKPLVPDMRGCFASDRIMVDGAKVGYMYRVEAVRDIDSGWRFFAGDEPREDTVDLGDEDFGIYEVNTICNYDPAIIPFLDAPSGSAFARVPGSDDFTREEFVRDEFLPGDDE
jgi:hypothetical protein